MLKLSLPKCQFDSEILNSSIVIKASDKMCLLN